MPSQSAPVDNSLVQNFMQRVSEKGGFSKGAINQLALGMQTGMPIATSKAGSPGVGKGAGFAPGKGAVSFAPGGVAQASQIQSTMNQGSIDLMEQFLNDQWSGFDKQQQQQQATSSAQYSPGKQ